MAALGEQSGFPQKLRSWAGWQRYWPTHELLLAAVLGIITLILGWVHGLPLVWPNLGSLLFTGMSPLVPFAAVAAWAALAYLMPEKGRLLHYTLAFAAYMLIVVFHFNAKLWMTSINPRLWDVAFLDIDHAIRPIIDASFSLHRGLKAITHFADQLYLFAFLAMFVCSTIIHSFGSFVIFRRMFFAAMMVHALGGLGYLIMPAIGPFIYEAGCNPLEAERQRFMVEVHQQVLNGGAQWLSANGGAHLFAGPAAMPSLHVASSAVFVIYAWKHLRWLAWAYMPLFVFIWMEAMATRWHYAIDLVAGLLLTSLCVALSERLIPELKDAPIKP